MKNSVVKRRSVTAGLSLLLVPLLAATSYGRRGISLVRQKNSVKVGCRLRDCSMTTRFAIW
jgi:hypothetical protein